MTQLRKMMLEELQRRSYSQTTVNSYPRIVESFAKHFWSFSGSAWAGTDTHLSGIPAEGGEARRPHHRSLYGGVAFFFCRTQKRAYPIEEVPYPKAPRRLPVILTQEEAVRLIDSAGNLYHRAMLITLYSTGMRRAELCRFKVEDIDSKRMLIRIQQGKGGKDRDVPLSPNALETLREYWRWMRPKTYLFPGTVNGSRADKPITPKVVWEACREAAQRAGITKPVRPHTLRHASAYYTTFQSLFILKTIGLGQPQSAAVYGHDGLLAPLPGLLAVGGLCD